MGVWFYTISLPHRPISSLSSKPDESQAAHEKTRDSGKLVCFIVLIIRRLGATVMGDHIATDPFREEDHLASKKSHWSFHPLHPAAVVSSCVHAFPMFASRGAGKPLPFPHDPGSLAALMNKNCIVSLWPAPSLCFYLSCDCLACRRIDEPRTASADHDAVTV